MRLLEPDRYFSSIASIDVEWDLARLRLSHVLLDVDNTLRRRDNGEVPLAVRRWLSDARHEGIELCLLSNNFHEDVYDLAADLDLPVVAKAMKPLPFSFHRAVRLMGGSPDTSVMVGDQLLTDVMGAHLVGMKAYLVRPLVNADLKHTLVMRRIEEQLLGNAVPEGSGCVQAEEALTNESIR